MQLLCNRIGAPFGHMRVTYSLDGSGGERLRVTEGLRYAILHFPAAIRCGWLQYW